MLKYREFLDLTEEEICTILTDIFHPVKIENIRKDSDWNTITAEITTGGWDDGDGELFEVTDEVELALPMSGHGISVDFSISDKDVWRYKQFLLAKGCNPLLKDNPYLVE